MDQIIKRLDSMAQELYCIKYNGKPLRLSSTKSGWSTIADAKKAIMNEFASFIYYRKTEFKTKSELLNYLLESEIIKIELIQ